MKRWARMGALGACCMLGFGCDQQTDVQRETRELQAAQKRVDKVTRELESQLASAKADVARLEQKLALARNGLTEEVLENEKELTEALKAQEHKVQSELGEAKREAEIHGRDTEAALKQLGQTGAATSNRPAPPIDPAQPASAPAGDLGRDELIPVKGGPDREPEGAVATEPDTPERQMPPTVITPNDPPAPVPAPPTVTHIPSSDTPPNNPANNPPSNAPAPDNAAPPKEELSPSPQPAP